MNQYRNSSGHPRADTDPGVGMRMGSRLRGNDGVHHGLPQPMSVARHQRFMLIAYVAASLLFGTLRAVAEAPRGYIARPIEAGSNYSRRAQDAYSAGVWTLDEIAAADSPLQPDAIQQVYERARIAMEEAVAAEPTMYEAHTYLGYVHRKLGNLDASLCAYETALKLKPNYVYAIEYQGEAYLALGDLERARFNYLRLYALDQALAAKLLDAIDQSITRPSR